MKKILFLISAFQLFQLSAFPAEQAIMVDRATDAVTAPAVIDFSAATLTLPATVTLDTEWDTLAKIEAVTGDNILTDTEGDAAYDALGAAAAVQADVDQNETDAAAAIALADSATQPGDIDTFAELDALVADQTLLNTATGYTQAAAAAAFATAAQGALADSATQPADLLVLDQTTAALYDTAGTETLVNTYLPFKWSGSGSDVARIGFNSNTDQALTVWNNTSTGSVVLAPGAVNHFEVTAAGEVLAPDLDTDNTITQAVGFDAATGELVLTSAIAGGAASLQLPNPNGIVFADGTATGNFRHIGTNDYTIAVTFKTPESDPASTCGVFSLFGGSTVTTLTVDDGQAIIWNPNLSSYGFYRYGSSSGNAVRYEFVMANDGQTHNITVAHVRTGDPVIYVDGAAVVATETILGTPPADNNSVASAFAYMGGISTFLPNSDCELISVTVYERALSAAEVSVAHDSGHWALGADRWGAGGVIAHYPLQEGIGEFIKDRSTIRADLRLGASGWSWREPTNKGSVRDFNLDANGSAAAIVDASDILPVNAFLTHAIVRNNDISSIALGAFDLRRADGVVANVVASNQSAIGAGELATLYMTDGGQIDDDFRLSVADNADAGMDDFDLEVFYEILD